MRENDCPSSDNSKVLEMETKTNRKAVAAKQKSKSFTRDMYFIRGMNIKAPAKE